jgi:hypothetical protein
VSAAPEPPLSRPVTMMPPWFAVIVIAAPGSLRIPHESAATR